MGDGVAIASVTEKPTMVGASGSSVTGVSGSSSPSTVMVAASVQRVPMQA